MPEWDRSWCVTRAALVGARVPACQPQSSHTSRPLFRVPLLTSLSATAHTFASVGAPRPS
jgi:hypothetical protein